jgi:DNA-binding CsgD family transcriptional regulator
MVRAARSVEGRRTGAIVGRAEQRARLRELLDGVIADGSRFVIIGGDAGAGKTTVVDAFVSDLGGPLADRKAQVIHGQCVPMGGEGLPYAPVVGALRELVARHGRDQILDWAGAGRTALGALLPDLVGAPVAGESLRLQLFEAVAKLLERASESGPLVVIMEDIHWADDSTRHLLRFMARALTDAPVMIVTTYRTDELTRRHPLRPFLAEVGRFGETARIDVPSLDRGEVAELLTVLLGHHPSNAVTDLVFRRSEGIPYFVEELTTSAARGCVDMPDTLRDALNVRVQALSDVSQHTLQIAAVAGNRVDHELLEAAAGQSQAELDQALREAIDAAVLVTDETGYGFRHALLREAIHDDLLPGQHARLHARFAAILEERPELITARRPDDLASEIAHHWSAAHQVNKAFDWALRAATAGHAAHHETLQMYERALELWDQVDDPEAIAGDHASVLERAARAATDAGENERALALVAASLDETDGVAEPETMINRLIMKSRLLTDLLRPGAVDAIQRALAMLPESSSDKFRARLLDHFAAVKMLSGAKQEAVAAARQAIEAATASGSATVEANARNTLGTSLVALGQEDEGLAELVAAGQLASGNMRAMIRYEINYSDALNLAGRYQQAVDLAVAGIEAAGALGLQRSMGAMLAGNAAEPLLALGEWDRAGRMVQRALELDPPEQHHIHLRLLLAWMHVWRGELEEAEAVLSEFRALIAEAAATPMYSGVALQVDADYAAAGGNYVRAWADTEKFLQHRTSFAASMIYPLLATGAAAARALDNQDRDQSSAAGGVRRAARVERVRAALAEAPPTGVRARWQPVIEASLDDTADSWRTAWKALTGELAAPAHLLPYAGLRLAQHLVVSRDRAEAREVLAEAGELAAKLGAGLLTSRLAALAQRAGLASGPVAPVPNPLASLTARELEVLELLAAGRSNGEVGSALFISTKTASVHVSNILAKLGVSSRGEAAALARRAGLPVRN